MTNNDYRYQLETPKVTGRRQQKFQCPHCGRKKCFVRYVDTKNGFCYVADTVGKCDHQHSCGYHYKPSEYYRDNPWDDGVRQRLACGQPQVRHLRTTVPPFLPLPTEYVARSHSPRSIFWQWMSTHVASRLHLTTQQLQQVYNDYQLGATRSANVIFWQIDEQHRVHGGHIMQYGIDGHRRGYQGWTHVPLIRAGLLPPDWTLRQCLFGQHLLARRPDAHVCLVESEKTALVMAAYRPELLWLATAGSGGLSPEKTACLRGRRVTLFPDSGCYDKWLHQMQQTKGIDYNISNRLEAYPPNTDLCDLMLDKTIRPSP